MQAKIKHLNKIYILKCDLRASTVPVILTFGERLFLGSEHIIENFKSPCAVSPIVFIGLQCH